MVEKCQNWKNANEEVDERINRIELIWDQTRQQTLFIKNIDRILDDEYRRTLDTAIGFLGEKLSNAVHSVQRVLKEDDGKRIGFHGFGRRVRKGKYAFIKDTLDEIIKDLEDCHKRFDPTWFLVMKMADSLIDQQLSRMTTTVSEANNGDNSPSKRPAELRRQSPIALARDVRKAIHTKEAPKAVMLSYRSMDQASIPYCTAVATTRQSASRGTHQEFIIDTLRRSPESNNEDLEKDVRSLAKRLANSDPYTFGLLNCKGVMPVPGGTSAINSFNLILRVPDGMKDPKSLRHMLLDTEAPASLSLTRRLRIAQQLASSISYVHSFNFVHKGVCPESILLLAGPQTTDSQQPNLHTFLVGFDNFRAANGSTALIGDAAWEKNIYRHPERQGEYPQDSYSMQHDVYSLGVCLLEIGLWGSFVEYASENEPQKPKDSKSYQEFRAWVDTRMNESDDGPQAFTTQSTDSQVSHSHRISVLLREYLLHLAETKLPHSMGELYKDVVVACLSPGGEEVDEDGDEDDWDYEDAEVDEDGMGVGVHFIQEILGKLTEIKL